MVEVLYSLVRAGRRAKLGPGQKCRGSPRTESVGLRPELVWTYGITLHIVCRAMLFS
jgi:hypothetical protein